MRSTITYLFIFFASILISCTAEKKVEDKEHWSYSGESSPENWAEIEKDGFCNGQNQSPINIVETNIEFSDSVKRNLNFHYAPQTLISRVENNGHSIQFDFEKGDSIQYQEHFYQLVQLHFHEPSEHTINGLRYPIELHFVHRNNELNDYTVISILGIEGKESHCFELFRHFLPIKNGEIKEVDASHDLSSLFPKKKDYFNYQGSLTTPPVAKMSTG